MRGAVVEVVEVVEVVVVVLLGLPSWTVLALGRQLPHRRCC